LGGCATCCTPWSTLNPPMTFSALPTSAPEVLTLAALAVAGTALIALSARRVFFSHQQRKEVETTEQNGRTDGGGSQTGERADTSGELQWQPTPNVQLPSGRWVYHPDFDIDHGSTGAIGSSGGSTWSEANVLPNGLLKDPGTDAPRVRGESVASAFSSSSEDGVHFRCAAGAELEAQQDERIIPPRIQRLPCVRP